MRNYTKVEISEQELEDIVRQNPGMIEEGLTYVDHQKQAAGGRLDVFLVDSGNALIVAELKVTQDDGMLLQALDYYDYVTANIEKYARLYGRFKIDPTQPVRMILVAPSFSQTLVNRSKWLDLPLSLFTFSCVKVDGESGAIAVFTERERENSTPPQADQVYTIDDHLDYITDPVVRAQVVTLIKEIRGWTVGNMSVDPIKYSLSFKVNGHWFAYLHVRRKHYIISTRDGEENYKDFAVKSEDELEQVKPVMKAAAERYAG